MCELMGMSFNKEVNAKFSFQGFVHRGNENRDGWGLAFYPDGSFAAQVIKEPIKANRSPMADFLQTYNEIHSSIYISHVRKSTSTVSYANTHPFIRQLKGREYVFAHNGNLLGDYKAELSLGRWIPVGTTDSEFAFCHLMDIIENQVHSWNSEAFSIVEESMRHINSFGHFNCLLSDGEYLFCYRDKDGYKGLCYTYREFPFSNARLVDEDLEVLLTNKKDPEEKGFIVATAKLTSGEEWNDLAKGGLMVFRKGVQIYPEIIEITEDNLLRALRYIRTEPHRTNVFMIANMVGLRIDKVTPLIQGLVERGYIMQDSRDTVDPFNSSATYYTVASKRNEIDKLLKKDEKECLGSYSSLNCIEADPDDRTPFCTRCQQVYKNGTKYCRRCNYDLELIDTRIFDILCKLNKNGYPTSTCCSGHADSHFRQYLIINKEIFDVAPPNGFTMLTRQGTTEIRSIEYHKAKEITSKKLRDKITQEELEQFAKENMENLREWTNMICLKKK